MNHPRI